jgi:hypothetical protein
MPDVELRNLEQARRYLVQGVWVQRVEPAIPATVRRALEWARELAAIGGLGCGFAEAFAAMGGSETASGGRQPPDSSH